MALRDRSKAACAELDFQKSEALLQQVNDQAVEVKKQLAREELPFVEHPPEVKRFTQQFNLPDSEPLLRRTKVLVVTGPTSIGKSAFCKSLFSSEKTYVVNCQNAVGEPYLKPWAENFSNYTAILFDEGNWKMVIENKMLFQGNDNVLHLSMSKTGMYTYPVLMWGVPLMICSNKFWKGFEEHGDPEDEEYLKKKLYFLGPIKGSHSVICETRYKR